MQTAPGVYAMADTREDSPDLEPRGGCSYELGPVIGQGSFGAVHQCLDLRTGEELACKVVPFAQLRSARGVDAIKREVGILQRLSGLHQGVVALRDVGQDETGSVHMVMEYMRGGDLFDRLKSHGRLPEPAARMLFRQVTNALAFCHVMGVCHRDIKPENILLDSNALGLYDMLSPNDAPPRVQAKLADFGLAMELPEGSTTSGFVGSPQYSAPSVLQGGEYGQKADVWSLGVVLYAMLSGRLPFASKAHDQKELMRAVASGRVSFSSPVWARVSEEAKDLIRWMMQVDEAQRPSAADVLFHPWLLAQTHRAPAPKARPAPLTPLTVMDPVCA